MTTERCTAVHLVGEFVHQCSKGSPHGGQHNCRACGRYWSDGDVTSPAVDTGIVAFIPARLAEREEAGQNVLMVRHIGNAVEALARWAIANSAKDRAILALHRPDTLSLEDFWDCTECDKPWPCQTVRLLAAIDADHPDYDASWKPVAT